MGTYLKQIQTACRWRILKGSDTLCGKTPEHVCNFKYSGSAIQANVQAIDSVMFSVDRARSNFLQPCKTLCIGSKINDQKILRIFRAAVHPVLTYTCETWQPRVEDTKNLENFNHWGLRCMVKIKSDDCASYSVPRTTFFGYPTKMSAAIWWSFLSTLKKRKSKSLQSSFCLYW